jgi:hypothetical protein
MFAKVGKVENAAESAIKAYSVATKVKASDLLYFPLFFLILQLRL